MTRLRKLLPVITLLACGAAFAAEPVDINAADAPALAAAISGAGMKRAQAIVAYREKHGPFKSVDDLVKVPGIGTKSLEKSRENLTVHP